ncbi:hypothetical protein ACFX2C_039378 [Malus domestica]
MAQDTSSGAKSRRPRSGMLRDKVQLVKRKDCDRYEIVQIPDLLAQKNAGIILVGVAGPSGAGKTIFTDKVLSFMPNIAVITMDNYNDASRIIDGNFDGKNLIFESIKHLFDLIVINFQLHFVEISADMCLVEWVTDSAFIISPRITFEVSVRLLGGLMALGYTIASILKRSSHIFCDEKVFVKSDWLEQLNRQYVQKLGLDGSYVPRTYIEQIQLEKLVNDVMTLPDDLKSQLSIDDDFVLSPKEALSRVSADRRNKYLNRDKTMSKLTKLAVNSRRFDGRNPESPAAISNQGVITQLSEQVSTLNERMDEFTFCVEEVNSKIMHQIDNLSNLVREYTAERFRKGRTYATGRMPDIESVVLVLALAIGGLGVFLFRSLL